MSSVRRELGDPSRHHWIDDVEAELIDLGVVEVRLEHARHLDRSVEGDVADPYRVLEHAPHVAAYDAQPEERVADRERARVEVVRFGRRRRRRSVEPRASWSAAWAWITRAPGRLSSRDWPGDNPLGSAGDRKSGRDRRVDH
jgi:hypothetical protein